MEEAVIVIKWNKDVIKGLKFYFTDTKLKTFIAIDDSTHKGSEISINSAGSYKYEVEVSLFSNYDPRDPDACIAYGEGEYQDCKDKEWREITESIFDCNPPWISPHNVCTGNFTLGDEDSHSWYTLFRDISFGRTKFTKTCKKPCTITRSLIRTRNIESE